MIEYIHARMFKWAAWSKRKEDGGMGYAPRSSCANLVSIRGTAPGPGRVTEDADALEIDGIVTKLRAASDHQYQVAFWFYLAGNMTAGRIAKELNCSERTTYNRLHSLHLAVKEALEDIDIAAQDRAADVRAAARQLPGKNVRRAT
ncbi:hypothetical protein GJ700_12600 [Duganella sp. FT92W]|uniref:Uncharacterized protein n=1 Tax=Pseudoduganella rivuli TaxID=2666085 RepID=A0A7X2IMG0_9BURK|nr:antiterminator Q family protein [Pseudoduganella rivuli]MRV72549.1 hypothetical protein [Pseudoduganella rivuli]